RLQAVAGVLEVQGHQPPDGQVRVGVGPWLPNLGHQPVVLPKRLFLVPTQANLPPADADVPGPLALPVPGLRNLPRHATLPSSCRMGPGSNPGPTRARVSPAPPPRISSSPRTASAPRSTTAGQTR